MNPCWAKPSGLRSVEDLHVSCYLWISDSCLDFVTDSSQKGTLHMDAVCIVCDLFMLLFFFVCTFSEVVLMEDEW